MNLDFYDSSSSRPHSKLTELGWKPSLVSQLQARGCETLEDIANNLNSDDIASMKGVGEKSLHLIRICLSSAGLSLNPGPFPLPDPKEVALREAVTQWVRNQYPSLKHFPERGYNRRQYHRAMVEGAKALGLGNELAATIQNWETEIRLSEVRSANAKKQHQRRK